MAIITLAAALGSEERFQSFLCAAPDLKGSMKPPESVEQIWYMVDLKSVENGDGGAFISQYGDKNRL